MFFGGPTGGGVWSGGGRRVDGPAGCAVSMADLFKWIREEPDLVTAAMECQEFLDLVSKFSEEGTPLLPMMADVSAVVDGT